MPENELVFKIVYFIAVCGIALVLQSLATHAAKLVLDRDNIPRGSIILNLIRALIWFLALLFVLEPVFGVKPTAFIAALGVTSIAISFGLQNTISNIVAGLELMLAHVIKVGDWIEVGNYKGVVTDITWRATTIRTLLGDTVVFPNSILNSTTLNKYSELSKRSFVISLDVHPEADIAEVERDIIESINREVAEYIDPELGVSIYHTGYGSFGFRFDVRVGIKDLNDHMAARSATVRAVSGRPWLARW